MAMLVPDAYNIETVLATIAAQGASSRAAVARKVNLSRTTISTIVGKLMALSLVAEKSVHINGRGRPGIILDLDDSRWRSLGAEYHSGKWSFVSTNLKGEILDRAVLKVNGNSPAEFLDRLVSGLRDFAGNLSGDLLPAVGIGVPGLVDCEKNVILSADDLGWKEVAVGSRVKDALGLEPMLINRNRASGLAEARFGAGRDVHGFVYIGIGTGISAAFINDGVLLNGSAFSAGEIGHTIMDTRGLVCGCGKRGCLQMYASGSAMAARAEKMIAEGRPSGLSALLTGQEGRQESRSLTGEDICTAAAAGDGLAAECLNEAGRFLGLAVANIITSLNPDKIVIGGPIGLMEGALIDLIREMAAAWSMPHAFHSASIERGRLDDFVGAHGAACRVLDRKYVLAQRGPYEVPRKT